MKKITFGKFYIKKKTFFKFKVISVASCYMIKKEIIDISMLSKNMSRITVKNLNIKKNKIFLFRWQ